MAVLPEHAHTWIGTQQTDIIILNQILITSDVDRGLPGSREYTTVYMIEPGEKATCFTHFIVLNECVEVNAVNGN